MITYRAANPDDYPQILAFLEGYDYFDPPAHEGGHWLIAENEAGAIRATVWFFYEPPFAYMDYWAGHGAAAVNVMRLAESLLRQIGVQRVLGVVQWENDRALTTTLRRLDAKTDGHAYYLTYKDLTNGAAKN